MAQANLQQTPALPPSGPLVQQVGGHAGGILVTEDESLLLKPALPREVAFYQFVRDGIADSTGLYRLKPWIPAFFGLLSLEGKLADPTADIEPGTVPIIVPVHDSDLEITSPSRHHNDNDGALVDSTHAQTLVLQNLLDGYHKPCILDVKLGTVLYDDDASEEKRARMIKKAAETTSLKTGIRLTAFQVYSNDSPDPIMYEKAYGYSLKPEQLPEAIRNFFPCATPTNTDVTTSPPSNSNAGLRADTLLTLLTSIHASLADIRTSLSGAHVRMVGSSVLIIYEGDWERAAAASGRGGGPNSVEAEEEEEEDEEIESDQIELEVDEQGDMIMTASTSSDTSDSSSDSSSYKDPEPRLYTISLIDFAHTRITPEQGPDNGVIMGMDTLIRLIAQRKDEVAAFIEAGKSGNR